MNVLSGAVYDYAHTTVPVTLGNYLEIGVFNGTGFAQIARNNPTKQCYAIDPFIEDGHTVASSQVNTGSVMTQQKQNFLSNTQNLSNVVLYEMTSARFLENLTDEACQVMNITTVVIDGDHHYPHVVVDFVLATRLLNKKAGQIIVDDTNVPDVGRAFNEFKEQFAHRIVDELSASDTTKILLIREFNE